MGRKWLPPWVARVEGLEEEVMAEMKERVCVVAEAWSAVVVGVTGMVDAVVEVVVGNVEMNVNVKKRGGRKDALMQRG